MADEEEKIPEAHVELAKEQDPPAVEGDAPDPEARPRSREDDKPEDPVEEQSSLPEPPSILEERKHEDESKEDESKEDETKEDEPKDDEPKTDETIVAQVQPSEPQQEENE